MQRLDNENIIENKSFECPGNLSPQGKENWKKAVAAYYFVTRTVVYGASNRPEDIIYTNLSVYKQVRDMRENIKPSDSYVGAIREGAIKALAYRAGNCAEQTYLTVLYLLSRECYSLHLISFISGDHIFTAIGLNDDSDLHQQTNIPPEAIILDFWKHDIYLATEFRNKVAADTTRALKRGIPEIVWSFAHNGTPWVPSKNNKEISNFLQQFLIDHSSTSEQELRLKNLIIGDANKPQKINQDTLMTEIREYQKHTLFKYKKQTLVNCPRTYANESGFGYLIEKMAENMLAQYLINKIPLNEITLEDVMPISRIPDFDIRSLHKEELGFPLFKNKFDRMYDNYSALFFKVNFCKSAYEKLIKFTDELETYIQLELSKRNDDPLHPIHITRCTIL